MKTILSLAFTLVAAAALAQTEINPVNIGSTPNDGTGDPLRTAFNKLNANDANLLSGKLEKTNPVVHGTLTGDLFGALSVGDTLNIGSAGTLQGFAKIITGPTHTWHTLELTPGAAGGAPGTPSSVIVHSPLSAQQMNATTFGDWNGFTGYEWMHGDGSFSLDKPGSTNNYSGLLTDSTFFDLLSFTNPATGPANAFHVGGQAVVTGGPGEVDIQFVGGTANGSAAVVNISADNLSAGTDVSAVNNVTAGNQVSAPLVSGTAVNGTTVNGTTVNGDIVNGGAVNAGSVNVTNGGNVMGRFILPTNGDIAFARHAITIANGANSDVAIQTNTFNELTGASAAFTTHGFAGGYDGKWAVVANQTSQNWTIANESSTDTQATNRIRTLTGGDIILYGNCIVYFWYSSNDSRWLYGGSTLTPHAANRKSLATTPQITQSAQTFVNNTPVPLECRVLIRSESAAVQFTYNGHGVGGTSITTLNYPTYFLLQPTDTITVTGASSFTADCYTNAF